MDNVSDMFANKIAEKGIDLIISVAENVPPCLVGDSLRLGQVLINLINNAIKFTDKGEVVLWASMLEQTEEKTKLQFSISDTGIGMTPEQLKKLFSSFSQADTSTSRKYGGTGLGLTISKRFVEMMNGKIWVKSESGKGSAFIFTVELELQKEGQTTSHGLPDDLQGKHVLVVDDSPATREVMMLVLLWFH